MLQYTCDEAHQNHSDAESDATYSQSTDHNHMHVDDTEEEKSVSDIDTSSDLNDSSPHYLHSPFDLFNGNTPTNSNLPKEIKECLKVGLEAALEAGQLINKYIHDTASKSQSLITKMTKADFQTQFDSRTEKLIITKILDAFPSHNIIAEESSETDNFEFSRNGFDWIIDPIDGTTNFLHGHNNVGICIGLKYKTQSILGIVFIPIWNELFFAVKGKGSYLMQTHNRDANDLCNYSNYKIQRIFTNKVNTKIESTNDLASAMVVLESGYKRDEKHCKYFSNILYEMLCRYKVRGVRMFGSCSVHMCCIASGRADVFFETGNLKPWDMVAGEVIVSEAGGYMLLANGDAFECTKGEILCCQSKETAEVMIGIDIL